MGVADDILSQAGSMDFSLTPFADHSFSSVFFFWLGCLLYIFMPIFFLIWVGVQVLALIGWVYPPRWAWGLITLFAIIPGFIIYERIREAIERPGGPVNPYGSILFQVGVVGMMVYLLSIGKILVVYLIERDPTRKNRTKKKKRSVPENRLRKP